MSSRSNKLTSLVTIFPLVAGLVLTGIGIIDLNTASETPESKPNNAYGVLAYSSYQLEPLNAGIILQDINLKEDVVNIKIDANLYLEAPKDSPYEVTFGFQLPGLSDQPSFYINGVDKEAGKTFTEFVVLEEKLVAYKAEGCSLIYVRFMAQPNFKYYQIVAVSNLRGLVSKRSFSTYDVSIPFSRTGSYLLTKSGPSVSTVNVEWGCSMFVPSGTELKWAIPYPDSLEVWMPTKEDGTPSESFNSYRWDAHVRGFDPNDVDVRSDIISVLLDLGVDSRLQGRLFFDSGLYMGIGVSLLVGGLHELLKILARMRET